MIFVVVGNWHNGFDRLVRTVDNAMARDLLNEDVLVQLGDGHYTPSRARHFRYCESSDFERHLRQSRIVIAHAGVGVMTSAVRFGKAAVVLPRRSELGEHYDDHQFETARQFEALGYVLVAYHEDHVLEKVEQATTFTPASLEPSTELFDAIDAFLFCLASSRCQ